MIPRIVNQYGRFFSWGDTGVSSTSHDHGGANRHIGESVLVVVLLDCDVAAGVAHGGVGDGGSWEQGRRRARWLDGGAALVETRLGLLGPLYDALPWAVGAHEDEEARGEEDEEREACDYEGDEEEDGERARQYAACGNKTKSDVAC